MFGSIFKIETNFLCLKKAIEFIRTYFNILILSLQKQYCSYLIIIKPLNIFSIHKERRILTVSMVIKNSEIFGLVT